MLGRCNGSSDLVKMVNDNREECKYNKAASNSSNAHYIPRIFTPSE